MSRSFGNKYVCPLFVYSDEFEPENALGSHARKNKIGGLYTILPCFPPHIVGWMQERPISASGSETTYLGARLKNDLSRRPVQERPISAPG